jgi:2-keto-3-deoxy-L-rhamnonate aldolase RhmA
MVERGFRLVTVGSDTTLLSAMARQSVDSVRQAMARPR